MFKTLIEFIQFLFISKKFWLIPIVLVLIILGFAIVLGQGSSPVVPFIYAIF